MEFSSLSYQNCYLVEFSVSAGHILKTWTETGEFNFLNEWNIGFRAVLGSQWNWVQSTETSCTPCLSPTRGALVTVGGPTWTYRHPAMKLLPPDLIPSSINLEKSRKVPECLTHNHPIWTQILLLPVKTTTTFWKDDILCSPVAKWVGTRESSGVWTVGDNMYSFTKGMFHEDLLRAHTHVLKTLC